MNSISSSPGSQTEPLELSNYIVAFIDLLGQRAAMAGQGLLPDLSADPDRDKFHESVRRSLGSVYSLYYRSESLLSALYKRGDSPLRSALDHSQKLEWDNVLRAAVVTQRWSDGIMTYANIAAERSSCATLSAFDIIYSSGALCLLGLASKQPIRGGIDLAWGAQFRSGELNGPAVACAYHMESEVAQYPRIAVSNRTNEWLQDCGAADKKGDHSLLATFADASLKMLTTDTDGVVIVDYLGGNFRQLIGEAQHAPLITKASAFVRDQLAEHSGARDDKLASRYARLECYFRERGFAWR